MEIIRNRKERTLLLSQKKYIKSLLKRFNKEKLNPVSIPGEIGIKLEKNDKQALKEDITLY